MLLSVIKDTPITMEKMDDIVWSINPRNDSLEYLMLSEAICFQAFEAKNIDYTIQIQDNVQQVKLPMEYRQHIYLILKESINNIVKYRGQSCIIDVLYINSILEVKIKDNGRDLSRQNPEGNGIMNINPGPH
jgi:signal transduction histidine kinase